jgi:hypothetical protein
VDVLETKSLKQLDELEDDIDDSILQEYRKRRLLELQKKKERWIYGKAIHVKCDEYIEEITKCSERAPTHHVVLLLYSETNVLSQLLKQAFQSLAPKHGYVKFCYAVGSEVIPNFPQSRVPTILVYRNGTCIHQLIGSHIWNCAKTDEARVELVLSEKGVLENTRLQNYQPGKESISKTIKHSNNLSLNTLSSDDSSDSSVTPFNTLAQDRNYSSTRLFQSFRN